MKLIYLAILAIICFTVIAGCADLGMDQQGFVPSSKDRALEGYAPDVYPTYVPTPALGATGSGFTEQKLIKTGYLNLEVTDVPGAVESLKSLAVRHQGYLSSSTLSGAASDQMRASVVIRVPASAFDDTVHEIEASGTLLSASINADDVTQEYTDLQAQRGALQRQLEQYNRIMDKAEKVEDVLKIQVEIERVQIEFDRLEGRIRYFDNRIDYATITVSLQEPAPLGGNTGHDFVSVINGGIEGLLTTIDVIIIALLTLLPLIVLAAAGFGVYRWRQGRKKTSPPSTVVSLPSEKQ